MASSQEFIEYVCEQICGAGEITYKKMFGEYGVYCNGKIIGLVCDDQFFVKKTATGATLLPDCQEAPPYENAKPHFLIESLDDKELMSAFVAATYNELPMPETKKKQ